MNRKTLILAGVAAFAISATGANATVVTFDDLIGAGTLTDGYGGIVWNGNWQYYDGAEPPYTPASPLERIYPTNDDVTLATFNFASPVEFNGADFSGYNLVSVQFVLSLGGTQVATSGSLTPTDTPAFLSSGYSGLVDQVTVVDSVGTGDLWVMDNVTYNASAVPEPAAWELMLTGFGLAGLMLRKRSTVRVVIG